MGQPALEGAGGVGGGRRCGDLDFTDNSTDGCANYSLMRGNEDILSDIGLTFYKYQSFWLQWA
jgi:hypothetical protein